MNRNLNWYDAGVQREVNRRSLKYFVLLPVLGAIGIMGIIVGIAGLLAK